MATAWISRLVSGSSADPMSRALPSQVLQQSHTIKTSGHSMRIEWRYPVVYS